MKASLVSLNSRNWSNLSPKYRSTTVLSLFMGVYINFFLFVWIIALLYMATSVCFWTVGSVLLWLCLISLLESGRSSTLCYAVSNWAKWYLFFGPSHFIPSHNWNFALLPFFFVITWCTTNNCIGVIFMWVNKVSTFSNMCSP